MTPIQPQNQADPPLDLTKCFKGEQQLLSWEAAYAALCDPESASKSAPLRAFLTAESSVEILSKPWKPFTPASQSERNKFDTATAPIHVTPNGDYSIEDIKADSLWLSQQAQISEYSALRLAMLEWQARPAAQLLSGLTEEEALSVQEAAGISNLGASTFVTNSSIIGAPSSLSLQSGSQFDSPEQRKLRLISIFHSTRVSILRVSQLLICWSAAKDLRPQYGDTYRVCEDWLEELGRTIAEKQRSKSPTQQEPEFLDQCIQNMKTILAGMDDGYTWDVPESVQEAAEEEWRTSQATEAVHTLHIALVHADLFTQKFVHADTIHEWFITLANRNFFLDFQLPLPSQQHIVQLLHLLASLVSLAILKVHIVIEDLSSGNFTAWDPSSYVLNGSLIETITNVFGFAKQFGPSPATPAAFAWSIITWKLTGEASAIEQERDQQLLNDTGSRDSAHPHTALEEAVQFLARCESNDFFDKKIPSQDLAETCASFGILELITQLVSLGMSAYGTRVDRISRDRLRLLHLQVISAGLSSGIVTYSTELIFAAHAILAGNRTFWAWVDSDTDLQADPVVSMFLQDDAVLRPALLGESQLRYPYETIPLLKFSSALTRGEKSAHDGIPSVANNLVNTATLMQRLPKDFVDYRLIREEENANYIALSVGLPQFISGTTSNFRATQRRLITSNASANSQDPMVIPAETEGNIADDRAQPYVAVWHYPHSALEYLVRLLSTFMVGSNRVEYASQEATSLENATEIIGFFADLLYSSIRASKELDDGGACSSELLEALDIGVNRSQDTVSTVLGIFEQELLQQCQQPGREGSLELLVNCTHFIHALVVVAPNRIWPWLSRSRLLETDGNGGSLASILIGTEMVIGSYNFLIGCIRLFQSLVEDAVDRSVIRKATGKTVTRFGAAPASGSGTSEKIMSNILLVFGKTLASIYESSLSWKYSRIEDRLEINIGISNAFTSILEYAYGVDDAPKLSSKLTGLIAPIAEYITELFLSKSENDLPTNPILASLLSGTDVDRSSILTSTTDLWNNQTRTALLFSDILVRVGILLNRPWTHLEQQLFKATPLLARLYASNDIYKSPVVRLLESLVRGAVRSVQPVPEKQRNGEKKDSKIEPPSLLGHLGPKTAKNFLSILSDLDKPLKIIDIQTNVWNLLSAVVSCKQQWFALYLLTGTTPRESIRNKSTAGPGPSKNKALLTYALDALSDLGLGEPNRPMPLYTAMLEFVSSAQNSWSWAMSDLRQHKFIQELLAFLKWLSNQPREVKAEADVVKRSYENKFAALAAEILAMHLHSARQIGNTAPLKEIVPSLIYLENSALELPSYNASLHANLKRNIEDKFRGISLANFKRTILSPIQFGRGYFYDIGLADKLLGFDVNWKGRRAGQGYSAEVVRANINLGLVESQVQLLQSWKLLAVELSNVLSRDERLVATLINVVRDCMVANAESTLPEALFGQLMILRADLAFVLLQKMVSVKVKAEETRRLLPAIWKTIRVSTPDFDTIFSGDQVEYYRSLLKILYLSLHFHLPDPSASVENQSFRQSFRASLPDKTMALTEPISNNLLEILSNVVAKGFRSLATQLHSEPESVFPADFALITAILQIILSIPEMANWHAQAALLFSNSNTIRYATSLFSWSDRLTISNNGVDDPIYGELSLLFILSLSSMQVLAETMAVEGILSQLNTANLMNFYRRPGGVSPFDTPSRLFSIWTKGILPLCLNLLDSVGPPIAGEISAFLNQFPEQLKRASNSLNSRTANKITLLIASEAHSLALIADILESNRAQGPRLGIQAGDIPVLDWDKENIKEDIEGWMARKGALRERIVVADESEAVLFNKKLQGDGAENMLEERVLRELDAAGDCLALGPQKFGSVGFC
ncbi:hypothetical protein K469DRAFT_631610 [Zopfia rhizophila CBS 207.26]|uniref:Uncharacterized protein n=1 Tax=Zopfia rhizophila CBS 207.26 TaxID=1314779 RepID=A0A6A6E5E1_9PEZI|nr:hypothetical protein K469DRAFT_631610 [Zopfia rhizophila CBS 207.26]